MRRPTPTTSSNTATRPDNTVDDANSASICAVSCAIWRVRSATACSSCARGGHRSRPLIPICSAACSQSRPLICAFSLPDDDREIVGNAGKASGDVGLPHKARRRLRRRSRLAPILLRARDLRRPVAGMCFIALRLVACHLGVILGGGEISPLVSLIVFCRRCGGKDALAAEGRFGCTFFERAIEGGARALLDLGERLRRADQRACRRIRMNELALKIEQRERIFLVVEERTRRFDEREDFSLAPMPANKTTDPASAKTLLEQANTLGCSEPASRRRSNRGPPLRGRLSARRRAEIASGPSAVIPRASASATVFAPSSASSAGLAKSSLPSRPTSRAGIGSATRRAMRVSARSSASGVDRGMKVMVLRWPTRSEHRG